MGVCGALYRPSARAQPSQAKNLRRGLVDSPAICDVQGVGVVLYSGGTDVLNAPALADITPGVGIDCGWHHKSYKVDCGMS